MLQQTQVSRVVVAFERFLERFPTVETLAGAPEAEVLALWSGLGYYRRARLLHGAAKYVVEEHAGRMPRRVEELRALPGVGVYTAAAVASLAFHEPVAMVDGNVTRVMLRLEGRHGRASDPKQVAWAKERADGLVQLAGRRPGPTLAAEALMELGATVCTPRSPRCEVCPMAGACVARAKGLTEVIPEPKRVGATPVVWAVSVVMEDAEGCVAIETRPATGMWASMVQAPTVEWSGEAREAAEVAREMIGLASSVALRERERFTHQTTHRRFEFTVVEVKRAGERVKRSVERTRPGVTWARRDAIGAMALSAVQSRVLLGA
ncbi:A/G-specific adenine glycosylase [Nodularia spumigena]|uniref:A/G-specific adenine glycosylase n=1 Tax=Nodularia spumigena TaxID=70799 RepID=UPI002B216784|nr:NUDIX domain-containing protein [Nodularia spumigena]